MQRNATANDHVDWARDRASEGFNVENVARIGYVAKGVVYAIVAWFAVDAAFNAGGQTTGSKGALAQIVDETYGQVLLILVAIGLAAYSFWRFVQAIADPDGRGTDAKGIVVRTGYFASGVVHSLLVVWAGRLISGGGGGASGGGGQDGASSFASTLMSESYGQWLVGIVGAIIVGFGIAQFVYGYQERFKKRLRLSEMSTRAREWAIRSGKAGLMARGVVFWVMGGFFIVAAYRADPSQAKGLGESLRALEQAPYGPYLLGVVGIGLVGYAIYLFVQARYRTFAHVI